MLKDLIAKLGGVAEFAGGDRHSLDEEHLVQVLIFGVNLAAVGHLFALDGVDQRQYICVVSPHALEDLLDVGGGHVPGAACRGTASNTDRLNAKLHYPCASQV